MERFLACENMMENDALSKDEELAKQRILIYYKNGYLTENLLFCQIFLC